MDYRSAREYLTGRCALRRKLQNNTYLELRGYGPAGKEPVAVRLHSTDVLTFHADGSIRVSTGGWDTSTTRDRIDTYLPSGWHVWSERGATILGNGVPWSSKGRVLDCAIVNGTVTITPDGKIKGGGSVEEHREAIRNADNERNRLRSRSRYWIRKAHGITVDRSACQANRYSCSTRPRFRRRLEQLGVGTYKCGCRVYHDTSKTRLTVDDILNEENQTVRTAKIHIYGLERFVVDAKAEALDTHGDYALLELPKARGSANWTPSIRVLKMVCPSTQAVYIASVPPHTAKVADALDWIFNTTDYLGQVTQQA